MAGAGEPEQKPEPIRCEIVCWNETGPVDANILAGRLNHLCGVEGIRVLMLDGPQAWKSSSNGLEFARVSERQLKHGGQDRPAGHGEAGDLPALCRVLPGCVRRSVPQGLATVGNPRAARLAAGRVVVESYPFAAGSRWG